MQTIDRDSLRLKMKGADDLMLAEILPRQGYDEFHIPGGVNISLKHDDFHLRIRPAANKDDAVVVYCRNADCDDSARVAKKLDAVGSTLVFDYEAGKEGLRNADLPIE